MWIAYGRHQTKNVYKFWKKSKNLIKQLHESEGVKKMMNSSTSFFFMQTGSIKLRQWTNNRSGSKTNDSIVCIVKKIIGNSSHEKSIN